LTAAAPQPSAQRTPPAFRWLLNERAMLAGDVLRRREHIGRLEDEIDALEAKVAALDETMRLADSRIDPTAAGVVRTSGNPAN
jgi:hypothetical protein